MNIHSRAVVGALAAAMLVAGSASARIYTYAFEGDAYFIRTSVESLQNLPFHAPYTMTFTTDDTLGRTDVYPGAYNFFAGSTYGTGPATTVVLSIPDRTLLTLNGLYSSNILSERFGFFNGRIYIETTQRNDQEYWRMDTSIIGFTPANAPNFGFGLPGRYVITEQMSANATLYYGDTLSALIPTSLTISVSNGVPEPATWALMIGGFGLAGVGLRRRKRLTV